MKVLLMSHDELKALPSAVVQSDSFDNIANMEMRETIENALSELKPHEADIIRSRFGFNDECESRTLNSIGAEYEVTNTRIRHIEERALRKLRLMAMRDKHNLRDFIRK